MTDTSSSLPICVYCGTQRPADETLCPNCGRPWIDVSVDDPESPTDPTSEDTDVAVAGAAVVAASAPAASSQATPPLVPPAAAGSLSADDTGEFSFDDWTLPPEPKGGKAKWVIPIILLLTVGGMWALVFMDRGVPSATTTLVASETSTSLATTTTADTTTTQPETTTTSSTTTTVPWPAADTWEPVGDAIPVTELGLKASGIGPIDLGTSIEASAGALVASLGSGDAAGFDMSMCDGTEWYWITWGDLWGIFDGYDSDATFIAYRYENDGEGAPDPTLETLSGVRLGDTVETLTNTYASYTVSFEVIDGKDHFRLSDGGELLLWGPLSSAEPQGIVEGIYSPDPCPSRN